MPVIPLPPNSTPRYFIDYTSMEIQHTVMFRTETPDNSGGILFNQLIDGMLACMRQDDTILQLRYAAQGSDVTFPIVQYGFPGTLSNSSSIADDPESVFISCPFRGNPSGRKGRYDFYFSSNVIPLDLNNRFSWGTVPQLAQLEAALIQLADIGQGGNQIVDISGTRILFNQYWNRAKSSYWQRKQRLG